MRLLDTPCAWRSGLGEKAGFRGKMLLACHCRATLRAAATGLGTALHLAVVAHASTGLGALAADLRARTAGGRVNCSDAQHGVGAGSRSEERRVGKECVSTCKSR